MSKRFTWSLVLLSLFALSGCGALNRGPQRATGVNVYFLPYSATKDAPDLTGGFSVAQEMHLAPGMLPVYGDGQQLVAAVLRQPETIRKSGIWVVVVDAQTYSERERKLLDGLTAAAREADLPLFITQARDLPRGSWVRMS